MAEPDDIPAVFLDQYKLAVEMADRVSARRATANGFFVTVQSALATAFGFSNHERWPLAVAGIIVAAAWWLSLRSYRMLNGAKFEVINKMEERLPLAPYRDEWAILDQKEGPLHKRYAALSFVEQTVPIAFFGYRDSPIGPYLPFGLPLLGGRRGGVRGRLANLSAPRRSAIATADSATSRVTVASGRAAERFRRYRRLPGRPEADAHPDL